MDRAGDDGSAMLLLLGAYLLTLLAAICAIDARFGIIPDSLVVALAVGGAIGTVLEGQHTGLERGLEAVLVLALGAGFRSAYRTIRGHDGLGFGDIKLAAAGTLWIGIEGLPGLLLIAVASAFLSLLILAVQGSKLHGKQAISFGPHLAVGLWFNWVTDLIQLNV
jgi:leader peptidase (prepilin peptidase)/N-methyltransferase